MYEALFALVVKVARVSKGATEALVKINSSLDYQGILNRQGGQSRHPFRGIWSAYHVPLKHK
jgi:hypothetical protein